MKWLALGLVFVVACSCATTGRAASFTLNHKQFIPTPWHIAQYLIVEECTGIKGDVSRVDWFVADAILTFPDPKISVWEALNAFSPSDRKGGQWHPIEDSDRSSITFDARFVFDHQTVRHEILHDLLWGGEHSNPLFARCTQPGG